MIAKIENVADAWVGTSGCKSVLAEMELSCFFNSYREGKQHAIPCPNWPPFRSSDKSEYFICCDIVITNSIGNQIGYKYACRQRKGMCPKICSGCWTTSNMPSTSEYVLKIDSRILGHFWHVISKHIRFHILPDIAHKHARPFLVWGAWDLAKYSMVN